MQESISWVGKESERGMREGGREGGREGTIGELI